MALSGAFIGDAGYQTTAEDTRQILESVFGSTTALLTDDSFLVSPGSGLQVSISAGKAVMEGLSSVTQGAYHVWSKTAILKAVNPPGVLDRYDTLLMVVADGQYGALTLPEGPQFVWATGTPAGSPVPISDATITSSYAQPGSWMRIADVRVNVGATSFTTGNITQPNRSKVQDQRMMHMIVEPTEIWPKDGTYIYNSWTLIGGGTTSQQSTSGKKLQKTFQVRANRFYKVNFYSDCIDADAGTVPGQDSGEIAIQIQSGSSVGIPGAAGSLTVVRGFAPLVGDNLVLNPYANIMGVMNGYAAGTYTVGVFLQTHTSTVGARCINQWRMTIEDVGPSIVEG